jgi:ethanolamine utilization protein EutN
MRLARVVGTAVSTVKHDELVGLSLLVCSPCGPDGAPSTEPLVVATDTVGAGVGEVVLLAEGSAARVPARLTASPTDAAIVGIVDAVQVGGTTTFSKSGARP